MGSRTSAGVLRATSGAVLAPLFGVALLAASASVAVLHLHAATLSDGPWAWLGDTAVVLDVIAALGILGVPAALRRELVERSGIHDIDAMSGGEFEARLAVLFADLDYAVTRTGASGDFGADLLLERDGERAVVQAKRYDGTVGIDAVQQVIGATRYYGAALALVVTNSTCTSAARALAGAHGVDLVERERLAGLLAAHPLAATRSSAAVVIAREVGGGVAIVLFAAWAVLRLVWWTCRTGVRITGALWRAGR